MRAIKLCLSFIILSMSSAAFSASADTVSTGNNTQSVYLEGANYGLFEYTDTESLIKSIKLLETFGFKTAVVADTLDLNSYHGSVIIFKPATSGKPLSSKDALAAFRKYMQPRQLSVQDALVIKNTPLSVNDGGTVIKQFYTVLFDGQNAEASQPFQVPKDGLGLTIVKMDNGKLLLITTTP